MPTQTLLPQADGSFRGWESLTGGDFGWEVLDDSDGTTHDSDATHLILPSFVFAAGRISFPLFLMAEGHVPQSVLLRLAARKETGVPELEIGFTKGGLIAVHAETFLPGATYGLTTRTFSTNPLTGQAWAEADLDGLEAHVQMKELTIAKARLTLLNGLLTYHGRTNPLRGETGPV